MRRAAIPVSILAASGVLAARIGTADAGHCGGGGGGTSSGYGGDAGEAVPACSDSSDIVGYRHCTKFGAWSNTLGLPEIFVEIGVASERFGSQISTTDGTLAHGEEQFSYRVTGPDGGRNADTAVLTKLRVGVGAGRWLYLGGELGVGGLVDAAPATAEMTSAGIFGTPEITQRGGVVADVLGFAGARGSVGNAVLSVELAGGVRSVGYRFESQYKSCQQSAFVTTVAGVAEARVRAEWWLSPRLAAGAAAGASLVERGSWTAGAYLGFHTRAFGGL